MNERLANWANLAQIVSGIAVVASLIYIALEVRGNTKAQQAATIQAISQDARAIGAAWPTGINPAQELTPEQRDVVVLYLYSSLRSFESWWLQWNLGTLSDEIFNAYTSFFVFTFSTPLSRDVWNSGASYFVPGFREYVDHWLAENPLPE